MPSGSPLTVERGGSQTLFCVACLLQRLTNTNVTRNIVLEHERGSVRAGSAALFWSVNAKMAAEGHQFVRLWGPRLVFSATLLSQLSLLP